MGQFEIKGEKTIKLVPDTIKLFINAEVFEGSVVDKEEEISKVKDKLKTSVVDIVKN